MPTYKKWLVVMFCLAAWHNIRGNYPTIELAPLIVVCGLLVILWLTATMPEED